jgi:uncharacterized membrane protein YheB (UPF0754 family)
MYFDIHSLRFFIYPVVGSLLGFITNFIAIKLLFRPRRRVLGLQGLLPKRQSEIAVRAGNIVNDHLVNSESIRTKINRERLLDAIDRFLEKNDQKLFGIPVSSIAFMKGTIKKIIASLLIDRDGYLKRRVIESFIDEGTVSGIVEQKIKSFDIRIIEKLIKKASGPEINFIIFSGAILGFIIGLAEAFIVI